MEPSEGYVRVLGRKIYYRSFGRPDKGTALVLSGGPYFRHDGLLPTADLVQFGYRVVMYDQLGCGRSDQPNGAKYYTQSRAVDEVEEIRRSLRLGRVHLLGASYGGALALDVALKYQKSLRSIVIVGGFASCALFLSELDRFFATMPKGIQDTITKCEEKGDVNNSKYLAAIDVWNHTQFCRLRVWPYDLWYALDRFNEEGAARNPLDRVKGWDITDRLPEIKLPCLITVGKYDRVRPKCARAIHRGIQGSKLVMFENGSHTPMWEDRVRFIEVVRDFLDGISQSPRKRP